MFNSKMTFQGEAKEKKYLFKSIPRMKTIVDKPSRNERRLLTVNHDDHVDENIGPELKIILSQLESRIM